MIAVCSVRGTVSLDVDGKGCGMEGNEERNEGGLDAVGGLSVDSRAGAAAGKHPIRCRATR